MSDERIEFVHARVAEKVRELEVTYDGLEFPHMHSENLRQQSEERGKLWAEVNDARMIDNSLAWDGILLEFIHGAVAEQDPALRIERLIHTSALIAASIAQLEDELLDAADAALEYEDDDEDDE